MELNGPMIHRRAETRSGLVVFAAGHRGDGVKTGRDRVSRVGERLPAVLAPGSRLDTRGLEGVDGRQRSASRFERLFGCPGADELVEELAVQGADDLRMGVG